MNAPFDPESVLAECRVSYFLSSGPGGQRRDRKRTAVRLVHEPTGIVVVAGRRRSRAQNLKEALDRLVERLRERAKPEKPRRKTRVPARVRESILKEKKRRSEKKERRRKVRREDYE
jgi:protein subunit release factor B